MKMVRTVFSEKYKPRFKHKLEVSKDAVRYVAAWLKQHDDEVIDWSDKQTVAKDYSEFKDHQDNGDIWFRTVEGEGEWNRLEVKCRTNLHFISLETWPTSYKDGPYVCGCHVWDHANPKIWGIMSLNGKMTNYLFIRPGTRRHWTRHYVFDPQFGCSQWTYACPLEYVTFHPIQLEERNE